MLVREVKDIVRKWAEEEASQAPNFYGAFYSGSINWMDDNDPFPPTSDVDVHIVLENYPERYGPYVKHRYHTILLETHNIPSELVETPEAVLSAYHLAAHFTRQNIIMDPTGTLSRVQLRVSQEFARSTWVRKRVQDAYGWAMFSGEFFANSPDFHEVLGCVYPVLIFAHVVLVADLKNPAVRKGLMSAREVLARYDQLACHESILGVLGSAHMSREQVEAHLNSCADMFDVAKAYVKTPFWGSSTINDDGRPTVIDGNREIIEMGYHREAMQWIANTYIWCQMALDNDAPAEVKQRFAPGFEHFLQDLGIASAAERQQRLDQIKNFGPQLMETADIIMANNPAIVN